MPVGSPELDGVFAGDAVSRRRQESANVRVEHGEVELEVGEAGIRLPRGRLRVPARDVRVEDLCVSLDGVGKCRTWRTYNLVVDGIMRPGFSLVDHVMGSFVDAEDFVFLERPRRDV